MTIHLGSAVCVSSMAYEMPKARLAVLRSTADPLVVGIIKVPFFSFIVLIKYAHCTCARKLIFLSSLSDLSQAIILSSPSCQC